MTLPHGFLDELRTRISLSQVVGRKVTWDMRKSNQAKGDFWAPCPFHQEKTASFHVDDRKGFYYCFGCHAKGDALGFIKETENVGFMEAVEILAREAGMPMPERDPQARAQSDLATRLAKVTEAALQVFALNLNSAAARDARAYLQKRGLDGQALARFEIGFALNNRNAMFEALRAKGFAPDDIIAAGLATKPDDGSAPYDAFRDRIIFPIRDARGRCIGFGGRAMAADAKAKYLNSRETPLFDKGRALYNHGPAREAVAKGQPLIVAEGYMDVIALVRAGFGGAVAPLGTAITADQLRLMWRIAPEPIIALDGDTAGLRAAMRLIDLALPMLEAGRSLRFALMPQGQDPDDLIKAQGPSAMAQLLDTAMPLIELLWQRETQGRAFDSPERRAALEKSLKAASAQIADPDLRRHYDEELRNRLWAFLRPAPAKSPKVARFPLPNGRRAMGFADMPVQPLAATRASALALGQLDQQDMRLTLIFALLVRFPALIDRFEADLDRIGPLTGDYARLCAHLLRSPARADAAQMAQDLTQAGLWAVVERFLHLGHVAITPALLDKDPDRAADKAQKCLCEEFAKLAAERGYHQEWAEARAGLDRTEADPHLQWRLSEARNLRHQAHRAGALAGGADGTDDTTAQRNRLHDLIESRVWEKKSR